MKESDLGRIRATWDDGERYQILKESIQKRDREAESFVFDELSKKENKPIRKPLIMALRLLGTESSKN